MLMNTAILSQSTNGPVSERVLPDALARRIEAETIEAERKIQIAEAMKNLSPLEARVLNMRNGMNGSRKASQSDIARSLKISKKRVREIEDAALLKLKSDPRIRALHESLIN